VKVCCWKLGVSCVNCWWMKSGGLRSVAGFLSYVFSLMGDGRSDVIERRFEVGVLVEKKERRVRW
jgi:hypothetical protein